MSEWQEEVGAGIRDGGEGTDVKDGLGFDDGGQIEREDLGDEGVVGNDDRGGLG